jgi:cell filamentation protein
MVGEPYDAVDDPACYPDSNVLRNIPEFTTLDELEAFEVEMVGVRSLEAPPSGNFDPAHYRELHRHLYQDVYEWAGEYRNIRTIKGGSRFCHPEYIKQEMAKLFRMLDQSAFLPGAGVDEFISAAAQFLADLNAIHPFREGNGRTQLVFVRQLGRRVGHPFRSESVEREAFMRAMIESFHGRNEALIDELERMLA